MHLAHIQSRLLRAPPRVQQQHRGQSGTSRAALQHRALASGAALASQTSGMQPGSQGPFSHRPRAILAHLRACQGPRQSSQGRARLAGSPCRRGSPANATSHPLMLWMSFPVLPARSSTQQVCASQLWPSLDPISIPQQACLSGHPRACQDRRRLHHKKRACQAA